MARASTTLDEMAAKRQAVITEIFATEQNYVRDLRFTIDYFLERIRKQDILDKQQIAKLFSNIEDILVLVNQPFLRKLEAEPDRLEWIFLENVDMFKIYAVYCSNQPRIHSILESLMTASPRLRALNEEALNDPSTRNQGLSDFLILPMQRICKYPLLLDSLMKGTVNPSLEFDVLTEAIFRFKQLVSQINERTRRMENATKLNEIEQRIKDGKAYQIATGNRSVIWEGKLKMRGQKSVDLQNGARVFLFDDLLLCCYPQDPDDPKSLLIIKHQILLSSCYNVHVEEEEDTLNKHGESVGFEVWFQFKEEAHVKSNHDVREKTYQKKVRFKAVSKDERDVWIKKFRELPVMIARRDVQLLSRKHLVSGKATVSKLDQAGNASEDSKEAQTRRHRSRSKSGTPHEDQAASAINSTRSQTTKNLAAIPKIGTSKASGSAPEKLNSAISHHGALATSREHVEKDHIEKHAISAPMSARVGYSSKTISPPTTNWKGKKPTVGNLGSQSTSNISHSNPVSANDSPVHQRDSSLPNQTLVPKLSTSGAATSMRLSSQSSPRLHSSAPSPRHDDSLSSSSSSVLFSTPLIVSSQRNANYTTVKMVSPTLATSPRNFASGVPPATAEPSTVTILSAESSMIPNSPPTTNLMDSSVDSFIESSPSRTKPKHISLLSIPTSYIEDGSSDRGMVTTLSEDKVNVLIDGFATALLALQKLAQGTRSSTSNHSLPEHNFEAASESELLHHVRTKSGIDLNLWSIERDLVDVLDQNPEITRAIGILKRFGDHTPQLTPSSSLTNLPPFTESPADSISNQSALTSSQLSLVPTTPAIDIVEIPPTDTYGSMRRQSYTRSVSYTTSSKTKPFRPAHAPPPIPENATADQFSNNVPQIGRSRADSTARRPTREAPEGNSLRQNSKRLSSERLYPNPRLK